MNNAARFSETPPESAKSPEDAFHQYVDALDERTKQTAKYRAIMRTIDDSGDYAAGLVEIRKYVALRNAAMDKVTVRHAEAGREMSAEGAQQVLGEIRLAMSNPEKFLGNGASAEVFTIRRSVEEADLMVCAKVITNSERYAEGRMVSSEMDVLDQLRDLQVDGVRAPLPFFAFSTLRMEGYVMEELDAVNFRRVLEGQTTSGRKDELPPGFDFDAYFDDLRAYVKEMHKRGIVHNDLHLRNMMIDRVTGKPRVIDFGKAVLDREINKAETSIEEEALKDMESIRIAQAEVREWLKSKA